MMRPWGWALLAWGMLGTAWAGEPEVVGKVTVKEGALENVYVYAEGPALKAVVPTPGNGNAPVQAIAQRGVKFVPDVLVAQVGSTVAFPNQDAIFHNVFSLAPGNEFDLGFYRGGETRTHVLEQPGELDLYCNVHPQMIAKMLVVPNAFYARVQDDGSYKIGGLPPGKVTVVAWSPKHTPVRQEVTVSAGKPTRANFTLRARPVAKPATDKEGESHAQDD